MDKEHIKYTTIREDFSEYEIENGQILKFKLTLSDIINEKKDGKDVSMMGLKDVSAVITNRTIDTSALEYAPFEGVTEKDEKEELKYKPIKEIVNIYETQKTIILLAPVVKKVMSTSKKDGDGNPILRFNFNQKILSVMKEDLYTSI
jgi:hypothetical protein